MTYNLYVYDKRTKEYEKKGEYKTRQMAETKSKPHIDKNRKVKIIPMPERRDICVGFKVYKSNGELYGKIVEKTKNFYYIRRDFKQDKNDRAFFLKEYFLDKYESGIFIMKEEEDESSRRTI